MRGYCKHCNEEFEPRRRNHLYCTPSCKTMASYKRNNYQYVSGRYKKDETSNQNDVELPKNKKIEKKLKGLDKKFEELKDLIEQGQKTTTGLLNSTLGPILARIGEFTGKKIFWPGSLPATKDDINSLKNQNNEIKEQNKRLLNHLEKTDRMNYFQ